MKPFTLAISQFDAVGLDTKGLCIQVQNNKPSNLKNSIMYKSSRKVKRAQTSAVEVFCSHLPLKKYVDEILTSASLTTQ